LCYFSWVRAAAVIAEVVETAGETAGALCVVVGVEEVGEEGGH